MIKLDLFQHVYRPQNQISFFIFKIIRMQPEHPQPNHLLQPQQQPPNTRTLESSAIKQTQGEKPFHRLTFTVEDPKGRNSVLPQVLSSTSHPIIAGLHVLIKIGVVFIYLFLPFLTSTFNVLAAVVLASAIDFWIVKNLSGRFLVGLKWWVDFTEDGEQQWRFQCKVNQKGNTLTDQRAFWWTLIIFSLIWVVFSVINVLKFDIIQVTICIFSFTLLFFNLHSFYRCSNMQKQNVNRLFNIYGGKKAAQFISGSIISSFR